MSGYWCDSRGETAGAQRSNRRSTKEDLQRYLEETLAKLYENKDLYNQVQEQLK